MLQRVTVSGAGFMANQTVKVFWDSTLALPLAQTKTTGSGTFAATIYVPQAAKGTHTIIAKDKQSNQVAKATITVLPRVFLLHSSGKAGSLQVLWVDGFAPLEQVVALWQPGSQYLGKARTGTLGGLALLKGLRFHVPNQAAGQYQIAVVGLKTKVTTVVTFTIT